MDFINFCYTYVNFDADYDFDSFKVVSLFVCLLLTRTGSIHISLTTGPISPLFSHSYVNFDADYDSDGLKVVPLFVCLVLTRSRPCQALIIYFTWCLLYYRAWQSAKTLTEHERFRH